MKLGEFIEKFIEHNSIIRLVYKDKSGHRIVQEAWHDVSMSHEILNGKGKNRHYVDNEVLGICSIHAHIHADAINIVIEELEMQTYIEETVDDNKSFAETIGVDDNK